MRIPSAFLSCASAILLFALPIQSQNSPANNHDRDGGKNSDQPYRCSEYTAPTNVPPFNNLSVNGNMVFLNSRIQPDSVAVWAPPKNKIFILTDIVVQNRAPGDEPVAETQSTRFALTSPTGDISFTVFSNNTLSEHFKTGIPMSSPIRFYNIISSSAPFVEVFLTGVLRDCVGTI